MTLGLLFLGQNTHLLLSFLIKHLEHKSVLKQSDMQLDIFEVATYLADMSKTQPSVSTIGTISDLMNHLRKSIQNSLTDKTQDDNTLNWNNKYQSTVQKCLVQVSKKVHLSMSSL